VVATLITPRKALFSPFWGSKAVLWSDQSFVSAADLSSDDPAAQETADSLGLELTGATGVIQRGLEEAALKLENVLVSFTTYLSSNDLSANHLAAVFYTGSAPNQRRRVTLDQVVVSGRNPVFWSELKQWVVNQILIRLYLSASNKLESDRYTAKWEQFRKRDQIEMWPRLRRSGIPIVYRPMPCPAAYMQRNVDSWLASAAAVVGATATGAFDVAITYTDSTRYVSQTQNQNAESNPSVVQTVTLTSGQSVKADITNLVPPVGSVPLDLLPKGFTVPLNADGWNLYVGNTGSTLYLQNATSIPIATKTYTLPANPVLSGYQSNIGQYPEAFLAVMDLIQRG
jgi:hypothetical protein